MPNGVTSPQPGNRAGALAGGVGCQSPGSVPGVYAPVAAEPSLARAVRIALATLVPQAAPSVFAGPSGTAARDDSRSESNWAFSFGNKATRVVYAAWAAAAGSDAPPGAA